MDIEKMALVGKNTNIIPVNMTVNEFASTHSVNEIRNMVVSNDQPDYTRDCHGYDVLIEISGNIYFNKREIFRLGHYLNSLSEAWRLAKLFKEMFKTSYIPSVVESNSYTLVQDSLRSERVGNDAHAYYLYRKLGRQKHNSSEELKLHAKAYASYLTDIDEAERQRAFLRTLVNFEEYLRHLTPDDLLNVIGEYASKCMLPTSEWMDQLEVTKRLIKMY